MSPRHLWVQLLSFIFLSGATLLLLFIILAGIKESNPLNRIFYFQADTSGIGDAPPTSRWTLWNVCGVSSNGHNTACRPNHPAYAFQPDINFGSRSGVPATILNHHSTYFYLSRFSFAFFLIATIFTGIAWLSGLVSPFFWVAAAVTAGLVLAALFFQIIAASLATALYVKARNAFHSEGRAASLGVKLFAFAWTTVALLILCSIGYILAYRIARASIRAAGAVPLEEEKRRGRFFRRRRRYPPQGESGTHVLEPQAPPEQSSF
ncbi:SUR7/PalI family-domain-containing protein [Lipomyces kononenkoae]|uniref:SUR7/PalI family-domain-containing protein n=1 Tax=Lipomyces kononenkoae TaxID=34357 RepID=A0ACC3T026_LIPKO